MILRKESRKIFDAFCLDYLLRSATIENENWNFLIDNFICSRKKKYIFQLN